MRNPNPRRLRWSLYEHIQVDIQLDFIAYQLEPVDGSGSTQPGVG